MLRIFQAAIISSGKVHRRLLTKLNLHMVVDSGGEFISGVGRIDREVRVAAVDQHCGFNFLYLDAEKRLQAIGKGSSGIEYVVDQHNTLFPKAFKVAVDSDIALLRREFIEC